MTTTTFDELDLPPALARALATRGYDTPTPVQAAVMDPEIGERDLIVSSQTGSGKTIAFGAALARTLLGDGAEKLPRAAGPVALVVVPTRELAAQVRAELGWLLAETGMRIASFTGGTAVSGDLRALSRGVDLAIGTPGRLVDLLRRQRLELVHVKVAVLDEADEMLDLGFREDLELILQAAPAERRTLLLSATLPSEIRALARRYQRDALAVDPRAAQRAAAPGGGALSPGPARHDDISYVAHMIAGGDRLAAVVNVLRASEATRAIVFCTTREAVGQLHQALVARGFSATAMSGDRAQAERDRALDLVRRGDVRVLVATNVAARGLDLPEVDLIVHADLPLNTESLTHRSGRTGRAGRKGTAVVLATPAERRKAERLLAGAHVRVAWTAPPSADAIAAAARARLVAELLATAAPADDGAPVGSGSADHADEIVRRCAETIAPEELARRLIERELGRLPAGEPLHAVALHGAAPAQGFGPGQGGDRPFKRRGPTDLSRDAVLFRVNIGAKDQADPRWLLPLICRRGGVTRREVGAIRIGPHETLFEIAGEAARDYALASGERDPRAPHVRIEPANANAGAPAPAHPPAKAHMRPPAPAPAKAHPRAPAHPPAKAHTRAPAHPHAKPHPHPHPHAKKKGH